MECRLREAGEALMRVEQENADLQRENERLRRQIGDLSEAKK